MGKINDAVLNDILIPNSGRYREEVSVGPAFGVDASVIDLGDNKGLAISSDPLSLIPTLGLKESAWLSVHLTANDMATTGFAPQYTQFVLNLPTSLPPDQFKTYWKYIHTFCEDIGVSITGGHTGHIEGQNSPMPGGCTMFLSAPHDRMVVSSNARPGSIIVMTKETAISSSAILAKSFPETVAGKLGREAQQAGCDNFYRTSVLKDGIKAAECLKPNDELLAMHDVTEGGILGAVIEMAGASGCGVVVDNDKIPADTIQKQICDLFEIDHRFSIGAGSMIMAVKRGKEEALIRHLRQNGIPATAIGEFTADKGVYQQLTNGQSSDLVFDGQDPYWQAFFKAMNDGLK